MHGAGAFIMALTELEKSFFKRHEEEKKAAVWLISFISRFCLSACHGETNGIDVLIFLTCPRG
ncbi:hypothetical protein ACEQPO_22455 [Bacillus sp. SL00103]